MYSSYFSLSQEQRTIYDSYMQYLYEYHNKFGDGYCYEAATSLRKHLNKGEVLTFSRKYSYKGKTSISVKEIQDDNKYTVLFCLCDMEIPFDNMLYNGVTSWKYHTVYVLDHYVFTAELQHPIHLRSYRKLLDIINDERILARFEKKEIIKN